jgi:ribonuclease VapC
VIVVDSSALVAIAQREPERWAFLTVLHRTDVSYLSPVNYVETGIILIKRGLFANHAELNDWLAGMGVEQHDDIELGAPGLDAYLRYGKGFHPARLNLADCFAYALAKALDAPLLYKGDDFARTDVRSAL